MKKSIFTVYVPITEGQTQCNRLKQICIDNGLPIWDSISGWKYNENDSFFSYDKADNEFFIFYGDYYIKEWKYTQSTEAEFIELLKEYKK